MTVRLRELLPSVGGLLVSRIVVREALDRLPFLEVVESPDAVSLFVPDHDESRVGVEYLEAPSGGTRVIGVHGRSLDQGRTLSDVLIEDSFTVHTPVDRLWAFIQDVERIAPCMPGAELTEVVDDRTWKGKVLVKFGPVQMTFSGTVVMEERDDAAHRAKLSAKGSEQRGKGVANAKVESWLEPVGDDGTRVHINSDITITGAAAQLSRGLLPEVSRLLTKQFADCLESKLNEETAVPTPATSDTASAEPAPMEAPRAVGGFGLGLRALWATIVRFFSRLVGRRTET